MTTAIEYALMAGASYRDTRSDINKFPIPAGWSLVSRNPQDNATGFEAAAFGNGTNLATSTEIVISYAGTNGDGGGILTNPDKQADAALGLGLWSDQLGQAAAYYLEIKAINPGATISFTGHSLGGGLAALMSVFLIIGDRPNAVHLTEFPLHYAGTQTIPEAYHGGESSGVGRAGSIIRLFEHRASVPFGAALAG